MCSGLDRAGLPEAGEARRSADGGERWGTLVLHGPTGDVRTPVVAAGSLGEPSLGWRLQHLP